MGFEGVSLIQRYLRVAVAVSVTGSPHQGRSNGAIRRIASPSVVLVARGRDKLYSNCDLKIQAVASSVPHRDDARSDQGRNQPSERKI
jgi:hypothetical protein